MGTQWSALGVKCVVNIGNGCEINVNYGKMQRNHPNITYIYSLL